MIIPIIMAGGTGSRLWPLSRSHYPKQFIDLLGDETMLQQTIKRLEGLNTSPPFVICNEEHRFLVAEQLRANNIVHDNIILEPVGRNTAPAIALAALLAVKNEQHDPLLLVLAADHVFSDVSAFQKSLLAGVDVAESGKLVTFGIVPTEPHTGYGYIKKGERVDNTSFAVDSFAEKPALETAKKYLDSGEYLWNSGMFMFKASRYLAELEAYASDIYTQCVLAVEGAAEDLVFTRVEKEAFSACRDESVDYAVMENTKDAVVVPMDAGWNDVGSWTSLWDVSEKDSEANVLNGDVITVNTRNSLVRSNNRLIATVGIDNLVIVDTKDALMVADKNQVQDVKEIVNQLKKMQRSESEKHREIYRPWGMHDHIAEGKGYHVKKVTVRAGESIAMQMHYHRSEHWIVVSGTAKVYRDDEIFILTSNESTYIPAGVSHCLENPGKIPLEVIEVRSGSYLEEDDIMRTEKGDK